MAQWVCANLNEIEILQFRDFRFAASFQQYTGENKAAQET